MRKWLGETLAQIEAKKGKTSEPPPPAPQVAASEPAPLEPERKEDAGASETQIAAQARKGAVPAGDAGAVATKGVTAVIARR